MIRRISDKSTPAAISHLKINNTIIEQLPTEIANIIAFTIAHNSSSDHYTVTIYVRAVCVCVS